MPIFNSGLAPSQPTFQLGPVIDIGHDTDTDITSQSSLAEKSKLFDLKKVTSFITTRKSVASATISKKGSRLLVSQKSSGQLKRVNSNISSISSSKYWSFKVAKNHRTLFFFSPNNKLRALMIKITESKIFDAFIIFLIFLNCISLALANPNNSPTMILVLSIFEWIFTAIFTIELIMKVIALGFVLHPGSYMRSPWNVLDFLIVATSYLQILPGVSNYSSLRSLRALRPLRTVNGIPGLRIIVNALLQSIPPFINVLILLMFSFFMFGIFGVQLLKGVLKNRCVVSNSSKVVNGTTLWDYVIDETGSEIICSTFWLGRSCPISFEGNAVHCQSYANSNPFAGTMNFDHIGWGFMQIFQIYVGEEWTTIMYYYQDAWSHIIVVYFILVMFFGGFFALNLGLAVINDKFSHVNASTKKGGPSLKKRIIHKLKKRKITAWLVKKLSWIDYKSSDSDSLGSGEFSSEFSDTNSEYSDNKKVKSFRKIKKSKGEMLNKTASNMSFGNKKVFSSSIKNFNEVKRISTLGTVSTISDNSTEDLDYNSQEFIESDYTSKPKKLTVLAKKDSFAIHSKRLKKNGKKLNKKKNPWYCNIHIFAYQLLKKVRRAINHFVNNPWFGRAILLVIVINTLIMAIEHHNQPYVISRISEISNFIFIGIFTVEMLLKMFGLGITYFTDPFNALDVIVVITSYLDIIFSDFASFSALRSLRLLRVFKLLTWGSLRALSSTILNSLSSIFYLLIIFALFLFTMSLIGMLTFSGKINSKLEPVQNFEDFIHSFLTVFQITTKENWLKIYWNLMEANSGDFIQSIITILFMIVTIILGDFIILNLFLAILIQTFEEDTKKSFELKSIHSRHNLKELISNTTLDGELQVNPDSPTQKRGIRTILKEAWKKVQNRRRAYKNSTINEENSEKFQDSDVDTEKSPGTTTDSSSISSMELIFGDRHIMPLNGNSLLFISPSNKVRIFMRKVLIHNITNYFFVACSFVSALLPAIFGPYTDSNSVLGHIIFWLTLLLNFIFIFEMLLKIFVQGLIVFSWKKKKRTGFLNDPWNILDVIIIITDIIYLSLFFTNNSEIRAISALTVFRFFTRVASLKVVLNTLFRSIPAIVNVLIVCCLLFLVFGILGVQLFKGKFYYCSAERIGSEANCLFPEGVNRTLDFEWNKYTSSCSMKSQFLETIKQRSDCQYPLEWLNNSYNFDNLLSSLLVLFEVASIEQWPDISGYAISAVGVDMNPQPGYNIFAGFFFVIFVMIGAVFIINMFVGVVLSNFNRIKEEEDGALMLTLEQREWVSTQRLFMKLKLIRKTFPPKNPLRYILYLIVTDVRFEFFISVIIVSNVIFMALEFDQMPELLSKILNIANIVYTIVFSIEAILKIIGLGLFQYFRDSWNTFDFSVVLISIIGVIASYLETGIGLNPTIMRVFRVFRILRLVRLIKTTKQIRALLETLYYSIPSMMNVLLTVALACYMYAIIGMNLFYSMKIGKDINHLAHFRGIFPSLLTMIRISTSEDWNSIMRTLMNTSNCSGNECGNPWIAVPFFISFIIICTYVIMNLFIAVILDNFENQMKFEESALNSSDLSRFTEIWSEMDPKATYMIKTDLLKNLLQRVGPPLGLPADCTRAELIRKLVSLDIPEHQGYIHFIETLIPLARRVYNVELPEKERKKIERNLFRRYKSLKKMKSTLGYTTGEYFAATYIQAAYKGRQVRRTGAAVIGLTLVRTQSNRLKFKVDRKCLRVAKMRSLEKKEAGELSSESSEEEIIQYQYENDFESRFKRQIIPPININENSSTTNSENQDSIVHASIKSISGLIKESFKVNAKGSPRNESNKGSINNIIANYNMRSNSKNSIGESLRNLFKKSNSSTNISNDGNSSRYSSSARKYSITDNDNMQNDSIKSISGDIIPKSQNLRPPNEFIPEIKEISDSETESTTSLQSIPSHNTIFTSSKVEQYSSNKELNAIDDEILTFNQQVEDDQISNPTIQIVENLSEPITLTRSNFSIDSINSEDINEIINESPNKPQL